MMTNISLPQSLLKLRTRLWDWTAEENTVQCHLISSASLAVFSIWRMEVTTFVYIKHTEPWEKQVAGTCFNFEDNKVFVVKKISVDLDFNLDFTYDHRHVKLPNMWSHQGWCCPSKPETLWEVSLHQFNTLFLFSQDCSEQPSGRCGRLKQRFRNFKRNWTSHQRKHKVLLAGIDWDSFDQGCL